MKHEVRWRGGALARSSVSWPFAVLICNGQSLSLKIWPFEDYTFTPFQVVHLGRSHHTGFGLQIYHNRGDYPENIVFTGAETDIVIQEIARIGFKCRGKKNL